MREISIDIAGLGLILYSPPAVTHIAAGSNYLESNFWKPEDVARHVLDCQLTGFCTGSPGSYRVQFYEGRPDERVVLAAEFKLRLGLQVRSDAICVRDLYDLAKWSPTCPAEQQLPMTDGWYLVTVFSSAPPSGVLGDGQVIQIALEAVGCKPLLKWSGVPLLCERGTGHGGQ